MAANTNPIFTLTPVVGAALCPAVDTSQTAPSTSTTLVTAGAAGTRIAEIVGIPVGTVVTGLINLFLHDGSTFHLFDQLTIGAATLSQSAQWTRFFKPYRNLVIPAGWTLKIANTNASNNSLIKVVALGGDF